MDGLVWQDGLVEKSTFYRTVLLLTPCRTWIVPVIFERCTRKIGLDDETKGRSRAYSRIEEKHIVLKVLMNRSLQKHGIFCFIHTGGWTRCGQEPSNKFPVRIASSLVPPNENYVSAAHPQSLLLGMLCVTLHLLILEAAISHFFFRISFSIFPITENKIIKELGLHIFCRGALQSLMSNTPS